MTYSERYSGEPAAQIGSRPALNGIGPVIYTLFYPGYVDIFHYAVGKAGNTVTTSGGVLATLMLVMMFSVPLLGFAVAMQAADLRGSQAQQTRRRRIGFAMVAAPTLYCMVGVMQILASSPIPDQVVWVVLWCLGIGWMRTGRNDAGNAVYQDAKPLPWLRIAHGVSALVVLAYISFHLTNHLFAWLGQNTHAAVMDIGRTVYRSRFGEPILVTAMLFQTISGLVLAWRWSAQRLDFYQTFQVASGVFLSIFILGHMNAVFVLARAYFGIETGWDFASGAPSGLIHDWWSARLIPHYALAVFFVIGHLFSGMRVVWIAHGGNQRIVNLVWLAGTVLGASLSTAIMLAMCGFRL